jgi:rubrerythrin
MLVMATVVTSIMGSTAKSVGILYVPPEQAITDAGGATALSRSGLDPAFVADMLSACLAHERCGVHLYRSVAGRSSEPTLVSQYEEFGRETLEHVALLEQLISGAGGNPAYVSPAARATEKAASVLLESTFMLEGSIDLETAELAMLEAVMLAEAKDRANWEMLAQLVPQIADEELRRQMQEVTDVVLAQEVEHHSWARDTRAAMVITRAGGTPARGDMTSLASSDEATKSELYQAAQELGVEGRSTMTKEQLAKAVSERGGRS